MSLGITQSERRVGRGGFTGSSITVWCGTCRDWTVEHGDHCMWCQRRVTPTAAQTRRNALDVRRELERQAVEREAIVDKRIWRMSQEGGTLRSIAPVVGLSFRGVGRRLERMREHLPPAGDRS